MRARLIATVLAATALAGCGSSSSPTAIPPTLPAAAVPYLPSVHKSLTAAFLAHEAQAPGLDGRLSTWGFEGGADRYFQGESKRLQVVDSRTLRFRDASGAVAFVSFMRSHLAPYLGSYPKVKPFGRGILATGQECQCHLANPSYLALVAHGETVTWLEINGPGATQRRLTGLIARAP